MRTKQKKKKKGKVSKFFSYLEDYINWFEIIGFIFRGLFRLIAKIFN